MCLIKDTLARLLARVAVLIVSYYFSHASFIGVVKLYSTINFDFS